MGFSTMRTLHVGENDYCYGRIHVAARYTTFSGDSLSGWFRLFQKYLNTGACPKPLCQIVLKLVYLLLLQKLYDLRFYRGKLTLDFLFVFLIKLCHIRIAGLGKFRDYFGPHQVVAG